LNLPVLGRIRREGTKDESRSWKYSSFGFLTQIVSFVLHLGVFVNISAITCFLLIVPMLILNSGCAPASSRATEEQLPRLEPRVLGATTTTDALAKLARIREKGKNNLLFSLTFVEPPPKELMPSWTSLDQAFSQVAGSVITYLPMDYFNTIRNPTPLPTDSSATMTTGEKEILVTNSAGELVSNTLASTLRTWKAAENSDGSEARYLRLRMALAFDRDIKTSNKGIILRALAKVGTEQIEPQIDISNESYTGRITVKLGYVVETGSIGPHAVTVTADVARLGAEDRFGLIISSNGGQYYDKATVSHGLAAAVDEAVGHAVFVLLCKVMGLNYEQFLASTGNGGASLQLATLGRTEPGNTSSSTTYRIISGGSHNFSSGDTWVVRRVEGNSVILEVDSEKDPASKTQKRLHVGDFIRIRDESLREDRWVELLDIKFGTTAEFRETVMAPSNAR